VLEATDGAGAPCVLECVGTTATIGAAIAAAAPGGNIVLVGMESPRVEIALYEVITQERRLVGNLGYTQQRFRETAEWLCTRPSTVDGLIEARTDFVGAQERFRALAAGEDPSIKVIVQPTADGFKSGGV
jgi:L-iditol 2-dehydrogenase